MLNSRAQPSKVSSCRAISPGALGCTLKSQDEPPMVSSGCDRSPGPRCPGTMSTPGFAQLSRQAFPRHSPPAGHLARPLGFVPDSFCVALESTVRFNPARFYSTFKFLEGRHFSLYPPPQDPANGCFRKGYFSV